MTNLDSILKSRDITLSTKVDLVKAMVFPVVMYGCESWTIKKAEHQRIDAFEPWCWRRLLRVPWTARRSNQSILKEISPGCSLEGLMLKLKLQYFVHLMGRMDSFEKTLMLGKIEGRRKGDDRGWDGWMASLTQWTWVWVNSGIWWWTGGLACCSPWDRKDLYTTEWLNWTELKFVMFSYVYGLFLSGSHVLCSFVTSMSVNYLFYLILPLFGVYILLFLTYKWFFKDWKYDYFVCDMYVFQYVFSLFTFFVSFFWASLVAQLVVIQFCM